MLSLAGQQSSSVRSHEHSDIRREPRLRTAEEGAEEGSETEVEDQARTCPIRAALLTATYRFSGALVIPLRFAGSPAHRVPFSRNANYRSPCYTNIQLHMITLRTDAHFIRLQFRGDLLRPLGFEDDLRESACATIS